MFSEIFTPQQVAQLELLTINTKRSLIGQRYGNHTSLKRGHGIEFAEYRRYQPGDDPRHIDWGVYARSDKMYVKTFQEEQNISVFLILDTTSSMFAEADQAKWRYAQELLLALAYIALAGQETVTVCIPGVVTSFSFNGARSVYHLSKLLQEVKPVQPPVVTKAMQVATGALKVPGIAILISDFLYSLDEVMHHFGILLAKNLQITAIQMLGPHDVDPLQGGAEAILVDSETGEEVTLNGDREFQKRYQLKLQQHQEALRNLATHRSVTFAFTGVDQPVITFLTQRLSSLGVIS
jgi:uncharacterized protein (DUF58 family)